VLSLLVLPRVGLLLLLLVLVEDDEGSVLVALVNEVGGFGVARWATHPLGGVPEALSGGVPGVRDDLPLLQGLVLHQLETVLTFAQLTGHCLPTHKQHKYSYKTVDQFVACPDKPRIFILRKKEDTSFIC
jgi:hypothetical protein